MKTAHERLPCFVLRRSRIQGRGAFATRFIRKGTRIVEYRGELIDSDEADRRYDDDAMGRHHTFLFAIDKEMSIDGAVNGNEAAFINHSCDPNCEAVADGRRIFIHAIRSIAAGDELTYDYRYARQDTTDEEAKLLYPCRCGAKKCRGTILAPPKRPRAKKAASAPRGKKRAA
jgi:SET domain-containing protein